MLSNYVKEKEKVKEEIKGLFANLVHSNEVLNNSIKECNKLKFEEAKSYTMNVATKINDIDNYIIRILALYSPEARELRRFVAYLKITSAIVRINSNTKSFIKGFLEVCDNLDNHLITEYIVPLHTSALNALKLTNEMIDIDEEDELQDKFNEIVVEEHKTDDLNSLIEEKILNLDEEFVVINKLLKTIRKIEKIADRTREIANLLLYYKVGGQLSNV